MYDNFSFYCSVCEKSEYCGLGEGDYCDHYGDCDYCEQSYYYDGRQSLICDDCCHNSEKES